MNTTPSLEESVDHCRHIVSSVKQEISKSVIGQTSVVDQLMVALLADGHVLIEGVPGLGKTLLVRSLAKSVSAQFSRIQFTPDLMPSDVTGHVIYDMNQRQFEIRKGPVFTNFLLSDEINRAPAKTQSALLEVMQEKQITIEGKSYATGKPFLVLATQNPIEQDGTYPLPEAELDRFMFKVFIDYPEDQDEVEITRAVSESRPDRVFGLDEINPVMTAEALCEIQQITRKVQVDDAVSRYAVDIVRKSREWPGIFRGAGPRASIYLLLAAKASSLIKGRTFVTPNDVKDTVLPVLRHRILLTADKEIEGFGNDQVLGELVASVPAPRQ